MESKKLKELYEKYSLTASDFYQHKHYTIITRQGIDKIQAKERIFITYDVIRCEPEFCAVKAFAKKGDASIETFGSAKYGGKEWNKDRNNGKGGWDEHGNTTTWYIAEMAEKRAMSRAVLKLTGFYELGVFGEDESEDFKKPTKKAPVKEILDTTSIESLKKAINDCKTIADITKIYNNNKELHVSSTFMDLLKNRKEILIQNGITN